MKALVGEGEGAPWGFERLALVTPANGGQAIMPARGQVDNSGGQAIMPACRLLDNSGVRSKRVASSENSLLRGLFLNRHRIFSPLALPGPQLSR